VTGVEAAFNARTISEGEEGDNKMVRMGNGIDVDQVVIRGGMVGKVGDGLRTR